MLYLKRPNLVVVCRRLFHVEYSKVIVSQASIKDEGFICIFFWCSLGQGVLLFSSVELVEVIVPNLKSGPWLRYLSKMPHNLANRGLRVNLVFKCQISEEEKKYFIFLSTFSS